MKKISVFILIALAISFAFPGSKIVATVAGITSAIQSGASVPGDTIWIRGGTYRMLLEPYCSGTAARPIVIRSYPNEWAVFDNAGTNEANYVKGNFLEYRDLEFTNTNANVTRSEAGLNFGDSESFKLINVWATNSGATGINPYWGAKNSLVYGCLVTYYGRFDDPEGNNGYGIYGQNNLPSRKKFEDNIIFRGFGLWLLHLAGSSAAHIDGFDILGNTFFGHDLYSEKNPIALIGNFEVGAGKCADDVFSDNLLYRSNLWVGYNGDGATRFTHDGNFYFKGNITPTNVDYTSNAGNVFTTSADRIFVKPNKFVDRYTRNRGYVVVFNSSGAPSVSAILPQGMLAQGERYELLDVQNFKGAPIASGTYQGGAISVPMTSTAITQPSSIPAHRQGTSLPRHTDQDFGVFLVLGTVGVGTPPPPPPPPPTPAPSGTFSVSPSSLPSIGGSVTLTWTSSNATSATIGSTAVPVNGSTVYNVTASQTFRLTLTGPGGSRSYDVSVSVASAPPPPPPPTDSTQYLLGFRAGWNGGFQAGAASVICPPSVRDTVFLPGADSVQVTTKVWYRGKTATRTWRVR
jgi:hypothetical protein